MSKSNINDTLPKKDTDDDDDDEKANMNDANEKKKTSLAWITDASVARSEEI